MLQIVLESLQNTGLIGCDWAFPCAPAYKNKTWPHIFLLNNCHVINFSSYKATFCLVNPKEFAMQVVLLLLIFLLSCEILFFSKNFTDVNKFWKISVAEFGNVGHLLLARGFYISSPWLLYERMLESSNLYVWFFKYDWVSIHQLQSVILSFSVLVSTHEQQLVYYWFSITYSYNNIREREQSFYHQIHPFLIKQAMGSRKKKNIIIKSLLL